MENELPVQPAEGRSSKRDRLMGKLFKPKDKDKEKDRRFADQESAANVDAFLHSSDNLIVTHAPPPPPASSLPKLAKLDTTSISRYPQALAVNHQAQLNRPLAPGRHESRSPSRSPRPNRKGLIVKFSDAAPDVIGEGGDESEMPVMEISKRKKPRAPPPPPPSRKPVPPPGRLPPPPADNGPPRIDMDFRPKPLARTQTGYSSIFDNESESERESKSRDSSPPQSAHSIIVPGKRQPAKFLDSMDNSDDRRKSFIEIHSAEMREAEGRAFAEAARVASATSVSSHNWDEIDPSSAEPIAESPQSTRRGPPSPEVQITKPNLDYSPASLHSNASSIYSPEKPPLSQQLPARTEQPQSRPEQLSRQASIASYARQFARQDSMSSHREPPPSASTMSSFRFHDVVAAVGDEALNTFLERTKHFFELFRLHSETIKPLNKCVPKECARGGLWWFLKGRMGLEVAVRDRPTSPQGQMQNDMDKQQCYANLAKGYWLCQEIIPEILEARGLQPDPEITEVTQSLVTALKKLAISMKRNGFLPPEDTYLPQTIDKSIWVEYPPLTQDMIALLSGNGGSGMTAMVNPMSNLRLLDAFPVGDNNDNFSYGRVTADVYLMEQGRESQRIYFPCLLSMVRPQKSHGLVFVLASQNGHLQLPIQENKNVGPVWEDVRWRNETCCLDIRLPRGFVLTVQLVQKDYRMLWSMYDFGAKIQSSLYPRNDENVIFRATLRSFQYMDTDPQSRLFPKESVAQCDVALFERIYKETGPAGLRNWHLGFRVAVVTGPRTRTLSGINHVYPPSLPVQFGFFREGESPALALRFESSKSKGRMSLIFNEDKERIKFYTLVTGTALDHDEQIFADVPIKSFGVSQSLREPLGMAPFTRMPWKMARVVNDDAGGDQPSTVLSDRLKIVLEYQNGNVTDRVNVAPGELRIRLEVTNAKLLRILRQPQKDMTMSVSEAQVPKELPRNMMDALQLIRNNQTIRTFEFNNIKHLHEFQYALTGYEVIFDALAVTFAIARRRMVVPIHKKWEAGFTRIQVIRQEDKQLQLLAFFEDFHHGHCMNFVLKGTDVYETCHRSGKAGVKFVDAKFPLPQLPADKDGDYDDMAFVCLDVPDLPGEHDDISIMFEKEADRDALCQCLPAPTKGSARMSSRLK